MGNTYTKEDARRDLNRGRDMGSCGFAEKGDLMQTGGPKALYEYNKALKAAATDYERHNLALGFSIGLAEAAKSFIAGITWGPKQIELALTDQGCYLGKAMWNDAIYIPDEGCNCNPKRPGEDAKVPGGQKVVVSPIVLDLDGDGVETTDVNSGETMFDFDGDGVKNRTGWVSPDDGFLVFDRNNDSLVNDGREMWDGIY